jgi:ABC-type lipoprotein release transport system permease subunit
MPQSAGAFSWFVARRYLTARRRQAFISLISAV